METSKSAQNEKSNTSQTTTEINPNADGKITKVTTVVNVRRFSLNTKEYIELRKAIEVHNLNN